MDAFIFVGQALIALACLVYAVVARIVVWLMGGSWDD